MRIEVFYRSKYEDGRAKRLLPKLKSSVSGKVSGLKMIDIYLTDVPSIGTETAEELFLDPVAEELCINEFAADRVEFNGWSYLIEITYKPGVTDPVAVTAGETIIALTVKGIEGFTVQTARQYLIKSEVFSKAELISLLKTLYNPLIQNAEVISKGKWEQGVRPPELYPHVSDRKVPAVKTFDIAGMSDENLLEFSKTRLLALTLDEMQKIKEYYSLPETIGRREKAGISGNATDVELEMLAQTWSEHCKHKILNAEIHYTDRDKTKVIKSLFKEYIKDTTEELREKSPYLRSVFHDDSGVIVFDDKHLVCFKVETHNSPSALDPYGGAITGIVGVNRDILGTGKGAKPLFNTNVLCFGDPDTPKEDIPEGLLHPSQVLSGVHHGIIDGGNQSGIPVVAGAFIFDDSYIGKPLVFCGTGGILPAEINGEGAWIKHIDPGDNAVMIGGRIGKDGIHGATFSSLALNDESPTSAVQIGDPITQKKMSDFLLEARDLGLYKGLTDNGAGGLSSSLGEMAESSGGIQIELDKCPLKYQGLAPWEILVSESQERMSLAVPDTSLKQFLELAESRSVEAAVVGTFTESGYVEILYNHCAVGLLQLDFLHNGLPLMRLEAEWEAPERASVGLPADRDLKADLIKLLSDSTIASKEALVRQYDHEVKAGSVIKPFVGEKSDAPSDGAVFRPVYDSYRGVTVTHGICQRYSDIDTYHMAMCAVDEAYRAHIACGGDPDYTSALDNFCWPDPVESETTPDGKYKLAQLVRANMGLKKACIAYGIPLISGKDSMKNDTQLGGKKVSVRPTLLISLMGIIRDIRKSVSTDFKKPGDLIFLLGETNGELGGSSFEKITSMQFKNVPQVNTENAMKTYKALHKAINGELVSSCHDLSDGGLGVALAESALGGRVGFRIFLDRISGKVVNKMESARILFCETPSRFIVSIPVENRSAFLSLFKGSAVMEIGVVTGENKLQFLRDAQNILSISLNEVEKAWKTLMGEQNFYD